MESRPSSTTQRCVGYRSPARSESTRAVSLYGTGRNGKSTFLLTLQALMADYGHDRQRAPDGHGQPSGRWAAGAAIATHRGAPVVVASETEEGGKLSETVAKRLTRAMRSKRSHGRARRLRSCPRISCGCRQTIGLRPRAATRACGRCSSLSRLTSRSQQRSGTAPYHKPAGESAGILNWARGDALSGRRGGLGQPKGNRRRGERLPGRDGQAAPFIKDCCVVGSGRVRISHLRAGRSTTSGARRRRGRQSTPRSSARRWSRTSRRFTTGRRATGPGSWSWAEWQDLCNGARGENKKKY